MPPFQTASACRDRTPRGVGGSGVWRPRAGLPQSLRGEADLQLGLVPQLVRRGSNGSVVSGGSGMSGSHTAGKSMLVQGGLIQSDFRKREEGKLAAFAF